MIKKIIENGLDYCLRFKSFQDYLKSRAQPQSGFKYIPNDSNFSIYQVYSQYKFYDMQKDDIVLDIGANVGAFSIFISNTVKQVYAVEPALPNVLKHNIKLNNIKNITVFEKALGDGELNIEWRGKHKISGNSLAEIIELCGGHIDVLKCDCEGGEWCIKSPELKGIRRIEMEVHNFEGKHNFEDYLKMLSDAGFLYEYQITSKQIMLIHAESSAVF